MRLGLERNTESAVSFIGTDRIWPVLVSVNTTSCSWSFT
jgi:hypothetical protein